MLNCQCDNKYTCFVTLDDYNPADFPPFAVTVDLVVLTVEPPNLLVLLTRRSSEPFGGRWSLPGGFVAPDHDLLDAAQLTLQAKTGVALEHTHLEQLGSYGAPNRDPRMRVVSVAHLAMLPLADLGSDTDLDAEWLDVAALDDLELAFDHRTILEDGIERARAKLEYTTLATAFCAPTFTLAELRSIYKTTWGVELDAPNFARKVQASAGFVEATGETTSLGKGRPARTYRAGDGRTLNPPIERSRVASLDGRTGSIRSTDQSANL